MAIILAVDLRLRSTRRRLADLSPAEGHGPIICIFWTMTVVVLFLFCFLHVDFSVCVRPFYFECVLWGFCFFCFVVYAVIVLFQFIFLVVLSIFIVLVFLFFVFVSCFSLRVCLCGVDNKVLGNVCTYVCVYV